MDSQLQQNVVDQLLISAPITEGEAGDAIKVQRRKRRRVNRTCWPTKKKPKKKVMDTKPQEQQQPKAKPKQIKVTKFPEQELRFSQRLVDFKMKEQNNGKVPPLVIQKKRRMTVTAVDVVRQRPRRYTMYDDSSTTVPDSLMAGKSDDLEPIGGEGSSRMAEERILKQCPMKISCFLNRNLRKIERRNPILFALYKNKLKNFDDDPKSGFVYVAKLSESTKQKRELAKKDVREGFNWKRRHHEQSKIMNLELKFVCMKEKLGLLTEIQREASKFDLKIFSEAYLDAMSDPLKHLPRTPIFNRLQSVQKVQEVPKTFIPVPQFMVAEVEPPTSSKNYKNIKFTREDTNLNANVHQENMIVPSQIEKIEKKHKSAEKSPTEVVPIKKKKSNESQTKKVLQVAAGVQVGKKIKN